MVGAAAQTLSQTRFPLQFKSLFLAHNKATFPSQNVLGLATHLLFFSWGISLKLRKFEPASAASQPLKFRGKGADLRSLSRFTFYVSCLTPRGINQYQPVSSSNT